jgi:hypothetical protein
MVGTHPYNRLWRPIALWDVEAPIFSRQSAHRWRWGCQPYALAALYPQKESSYLFLLEAGRIKSIEKSNDLIGNRTRDLPACSIVPQLTTLPRAPRVLSHRNLKYRSEAVFFRKDLVFETFETSQMQLRFCEYAGCRIRTMVEKPVWTLGKN